MGRARLAPDPSVGVPDLQKCIEALCTSEGTWDLHKLLATGPVPKNWKASPDPVYLSSNVSTLCLSLFKVCTNGVVSSKKFRTALEKLQKEKGKRLNMSKYCDTDWADMIDQNVRIACAHFRELRASPQKYQTCMRKASLSEKDTIDKVLEVLQLPEDGFQPPTEDGNESKEVEKEKGKEQAEAELEKPDQKPEKASASTTVFGSSTSVFGRVLAKQISEASTPDKRLRKKTTPVGSPGMASSAVSTLKRQLASDTLETPADAARSSASDLVDVGLNADEEKELLQWMSKPVDLRRKKKQNKRRKKSTDLKKPAAASPSKKKPAGLQKTAKKEGAKKSSFINRKASTAYHSAKHFALKRGLTPEAALEEARQASAQMRSDIRAGIVVDPETEA